MESEFKGWEKVTRADIDQRLAAIGAKISLAYKSLQPKAAGYVGNQFARSKKPVYCYDIVGASDGKSFANIYGELYDRAEVSEVVDQIRGQYYETTKAIYIL